MISSVMQPPHLAQSINSSKMAEKDHILRMAQRANHLTEGLLKQGDTRADKRNSQSYAT